MSPKQLLFLICFFIALFVRTGSANDYFRAVVQSGNVPKVSRLVESRTYNLNAQDKKGRTALKIAADFYHTHPEIYDEIIRILVEGGADSNIEDQLGETPLLSIAYRVSFDQLAFSTFQYLVNHPCSKADVNHPDRTGNTALTILFAESKMSVLSL